MESDAAVEQMSVPPRVSVLIRTFNAEEFLRVVIRAVRRQRCDFPVEVIVVDSGSTDATREIAEAEGARVVCLERPFRPGYSINVGAQAARGEVCATISQTAFPVDEFWLPRLVEPLLRPDGPAGSFSRHRSLPGACPMEYGYLALTFSDTATTAPFSASACAFRRDVWEQFPWDETVPVGGPDDREWIMRIGDHGYRIEYVPGSAIYRSHGYDAASWYKRVHAGATTERRIMAHWNTDSPSESGFTLLRATVAHLVSSGNYVEIIRFIYLTPMLAIARSPLADRLGTRTNWVIDRIGAVDRRCFAPQARWDRAAAALMDGYWALDSV